MGLICYNAFATWQEQCHAEALGVLNSGHKEMILGESAVLCWITIIC